MKSQKKLFLSIAVVCLVAILSACGGEKASKPYLEQGEYAAYQGSEYVAACVELGNFGNACKFSWISSLYDVPVEDLSTKRGIHTGSTLDDISKAYETTHFTCYQQDLFDEPMSSLAGKLKTDGSCQLVTWTYFDKSEYEQMQGTPVTDDKKVTDLKSSGTCVEAQLIFDVEDGVVKEITIATVA